MITNTQASLDRIMPVRKKYLLFKPNVDSKPVGSQTRSNSYYFEPSNPKHRPKMVLSDKPLLVDVAEDELPFN